MIRMITIYDLESDRNTIIPVEKIKYIIEDNGNLTRIYLTNNLFFVVKMNFLEMIRFLEKNDIHFTHQNLQIEKVKPTPINPTYFTP